MLREELGVNLSTLKSLEKQGVIEITESDKLRNPLSLSNPCVSNLDIEYTDEQVKAIDTFAKDFEEGVRKTYLLYGVTGSGKTEVYIEMIKSIIAKGKQAILLIPEIALTFQTVRRLTNALGGRVSILNSRLSIGERSDQMERIMKGEVDVVIGPRSALFSPFSNLGIIIIDEEHESSYKSESIPKYHAREVAIKRASIDKASVVLGSATPEVTSFYKAKVGEYKLLTLTKRAGDCDLSEVEVVDMREELRLGNRSIISDRLKYLIADRLAKKEQIMLYINRRGYAGFVSCKACGYVEKCPHCDVALANHRGGRSVCHYCGYETAEKKACPKCNSTHYGGIKLGTQSIEDTLNAMFPFANVGRMDADTTRNKDGHEKILRAFLDKEIDILVGTQMIVKGHDYANVTLVGALAADISLFANDYTAAERTFELLTQAAGRAGRGLEAGKVIIQTYCPEDESIISASHQDYLEFYNKEIKFRELMRYPPFSEMMALLLSYEDEDYLQNACNYLRKFAKLVGDKYGAVVIGPSAPYVEKIEDKYRRVLYIKASDMEILVKIKEKLEEYLDINPGYDKIAIAFDVSPIRTA